MPVRSNIDTDALRRRVRQQADEAAADARQVIFGETQANCPVLTGALKGSGHIEGARIVYGDENIGYAVDQELEKGFMRNALKTQRQKAMEKFENKL